MGLALHTTPTAILRCRLNTKKLEMTDKMDRVKCITFDKKAQDNLPQHIKDKMKADRDNARKKSEGSEDIADVIVPKGTVCDYCGGSGWDSYPNHSTTHAPCPKCQP